MKGTDGIPYSVQFGPTSLWNVFLSPTVFMFVTHLDAQHHHDSLHVYMLLWLFLPLTFSSLRSSSSAPPLRSHKTTNGMRPVPDIFISPGAKLLSESLRFPFIFLFIRIICELEYRTNHLTEVRLNGEKDFSLITNLWTEQNWNKLFKSVICWTWKDWNPCRKHGCNKTLMFASFIVFRNVRVSPSLRSDLMFSSCHWSRSLRAV